MRITAVDPAVVEVPLKVPARGVHGTIPTQRSALVRVVTDEGILLSPGAVRSEGI